MWVSPFRYPRIKGYLLLPVAFRSLSRLSSALSAKASTLRSYQLNLLTSGAGCSLHLRLQRQTLRSWFITLASSSFDEVFTRKCLLSSTSCFGCLYLLQIQILNNCSIVVFGFQGTDLAVFMPLTIRCVDSQTFGLFRHVLRTMF